MKGMAVTAIFALVCTPLLGTEEVGFRLAQKHFVILGVLVNGQGPYDFLLDTGSTTSLLDRNVARDLGLQPLGETAIRTATGVERVAIARADRIDLGSKSAQNVVVLCSLLHGVRALDRNVRGVLGFNFLSRFQYLLDYAGKRLVFADRRDVEGTRVPFDTTRRSIMLTVDGNRLLLDTGATGVILFDADDLDIEVSLRSVRRVSTNDGRRIASSGWITRLDIGDESFRRLPVTLFPQTGLEDRADGLLPGALFRAIYFDHEQKFVVFNPELFRNLPLVSSAPPCVTCQSTRPRSGSVRPD
jgi:predicted aspartyl protease